MAEMQKQLGHSSYLSEAYNMTRGDKSSGNEDNYNEDDNNFL